MSHVSLIIYVEDEMRYVSVGQGMTHRNENLPYVTETTALRLSLSYNCEHTSHWNENVVTLRRRRNDQNRHDDHFNDDTLRFVCDSKMYRAARDYLLVQCLLLKATLYLRQQT